MSVLAAIGVVVLAVFYLATGLYALVEGKRLVWQPVPSDFFPKNPEIINMVIASIRANDPPWHGLHCSALGVTIKTQWSWDNATKATGLRVSGVDMPLRPIDLLRIRGAARHAQRNTDALQHAKAIAEFAKNVERFVDSRQ